MTDKHIIKLKPKEDLNEKIIKEKGNTKCIFYTDDICRNGDKTRDCINCARVEYHSLYSLNWDNQERLQKIIKQKEQECEELKENLKDFQEDCKGCPTCDEALYNANLYAKEYRKILATLTEIKKIAEPFCNACQEFEPEKSKNCINCTYCNYNKILQKISEVE